MFIIDIHNKFKISLNRHGITAFRQQNNIYICVCQMWIQKNFDHIVWRPTRHSINIVLCKVFVWHKVGLCPPRINCSYFTLLAKNFYTNWSHVAPSSSKFNMKDIHFRWLSLCFYVFVLRNVKTQLRNPKTQEKVFESWLLFGAFWLNPEDEGAYGWAQQICTWV